jgi:magnesium transporter
VASEVANAVYVVDEAGALAGVVSLASLLAAHGERTMGELARRDLPRVHPSDDQEQVAHAALSYGVIAVPVVGADGRFLGVVPPRALLEILHREHVEDLHRLAGIQRERGWARSALEAPPRRQAWHRLPWLLVGLVGSALATYVMSRFEQALQARVAIAFFVPGIVYLADAIGTQTEAVTVRGLSLSRVSLRHLAQHELLTGFLVGAALGAVAFPAVLLAFGDPSLAAAVGVALASAGTVAGGLGLLMPWLLDRVGLDPAFGSGPVATILQDVLSILIYFTMVELFVA